jgi:hypothetical protein
MLGKQAKVLGSRDMADLLAFANAAVIHSAIE